MIPPVIRSPYLRQPRHHTCAIFTFTFVAIGLLGCGESESNINMPEPEPEPDPRCSIDNLVGECPGERVCTDGACIIDLDNGVLVPSDIASTWDQIWSHFDREYGAFPAKPTLEWDLVRDETADELALTTTEFAAFDVMARGVERIGDGHTSVFAASICQADPGLGAGLSNVGACVTEGDDGLFVYRVAAGSAFALGDVLESIETREPEALIADGVRQPRCIRSQSSDAQLRQTVISSLMFRSQGESSAVVRRAGQPIEVTFAELPLLTCDGRLTDAELTLHGNEVESKQLAGGALYLRLNRFGTFAGGTFVDQPVTDTLRAVLETIEPTAGIVFDLRGNPGGFVTIYTALAGWLYAQPTDLFQCQSKNGPAHDAHTAPSRMTVTPDPTLQLTGKIAVLIDGRSFSASDFTSYFLRATGRAKTFGSASGGGFGGGGSAVVAGVNLGINGSLCSALDGTFLEGNAPAADHPMRLTPAAAQSGIDNIIESARVFVTTP